MTGLIKLAWNQSQTCLDFTASANFLSCKHKGKHVSLIQSHWNLWILSCNYAASADTVFKWSKCSAGTHLRYLQTYFGAFVQLKNGRTQI